ncbi:sigma-54-dependent Fis family transcriptional regulator [candidate division KSB3 bacterium]|uniref:Sigma-54-dependent Fis family transcriptional regulator n=1 Tax=candidate division KSB3 bacterium TaxID=2044937 RepID=A0A2G6E5M3_9BACT|nr:MAG: sigma-54-dependent Fis family transcriptional regulator [candidate division KSB3 bacterium]PIE29622.1 MAG: sigma-54-dependent Fis family transcriptional regulator [candidate division KSB3 bacterium]
MNAQLLIIDDKIKVCKSLAQNFDQRGYTTLYATSSREGLALFSRHPIGVVLLDIMLGAENGIDVLQQLQRLRPQVPVIMISGYGSIDSAVRSIKLGAFDYVTKPLDFEKLLQLVANAVQASEDHKKHTHLKDRVPARSPTLVTRNPRMLTLCETIKKLAATDLPILIMGENGTGKEIIADFIHVKSSRSSRKMHKINCAAFPETLLDNELFGHERGAYTGADTVFQGIFERADQSSLFLDEIGDMPLTIQAKILRTLQNNEIRRLGGKQTITVNVRFIAATNRNLEELIVEKSFRQDLFYRLNTAMLQLPPLRERKDDIPLLVKHFLTEYATANARSLKQLSDTVMERFLDYHWPGNVRELKNTLNYAAAISSGERVETEDLPPNFSELQQAPPAENIREEVEKNLILKTLQKTKYNKTKAAVLLNMSRKTLYNKLERYGISR